MENQKHWNNVYLSKSSNEVSWFQTHPTLSLELIKKTQISEHSNIIDVGSGASILPDYLLAEMVDIKALI
jgi:16S rRNA G527 N7-methylase RsmG